MLLCFFLFLVYVASFSFSFFSFFLSTFSLVEGVTCRLWNSFFYVFRDSIKSTKKNKQTKPNQTNLWCWLIEKGKGKREKGEGRLMVRKEWRLWPSFFTNFLLLTQFLQRTEISIYKTIDKNTLFFNGESRTTSLSECNRSADMSDWIDFAFTLSNNIANQWIITNCVGQEGRIIS